MIHRPASVLALAALWFGSTGAVQVATEQSLELGIIRAAPGIVKNLKQEVGKESLRVGVLKFLVRKGKSTPSDNVGPLNLSLARQLELALIYAVKIDDPMIVIENASAVAAKLAGSNHRTESGHTVLFKGAYQPAWNKQNGKVSADAFLTGEVDWKSDLRTMTVTIGCFYLKKNKSVSDLIRVARFQARAGAHIQAEGGAPILLRGPTGEEAATRTAARVLAKTERHPLDPNAEPYVKLEIRYNNTPVPLEFTRALVEARVPEPRKGQAVTFVLHRTAAAGKARLAVVLKVNGENTLFRETGPDYGCKKWILEEGMKPLIVEGYNTNLKEASPFKVVSRQESTGKEMNYGSNLGTISLVVYRQKEKKAIPPILFEATKEEREGALILSRGVYPREHLPLTRGGLREHLNDQIQKPITRGWIKPGTETVSSPLTEVEFVADPTPIQGAQIIYYKP